MTITWLHVSDFHFRQGESYDREVVLRSLVESVRWFRENRDGDWPKPDLVFASGDIAFSGQEAEYKLAGPFFDALLAAAGLDKRRLFVVPGNHDVERLRIVGLARTLGNNDDADAYLGSGEPIDHIAKAQRHFVDWYNAYFQGIRNFPETSPCGPAEMVDIGGNRIGVLPLNSALFCRGEDDHEKLWLGRRALGTAIEGLQSTSLNIALLHHPLDWLCGVERPNIRAALEGAVDVVLRGHLHENDVASTIGLAGGALHLAAGAAYQTRHYPNRALYVTVDGDNVLVRPIHYVDAPQEAWVHDTSLFPRTAKSFGRYKIPRASGPSKVTEAAEPRDAPQEQDALRIDRGILFEDLKSQSADAVVKSSTAVDRLYASLKKQAATAMAQSGALTDDIEDKIALWEGGKDPKVRAARLVETLLGFDFEVGKEVLLDAYHSLSKRQDHSGVEAVRTLSRLLLPWLFVVARVSDLGMWSRVTLGDVVGIPAGLTTMAEMIMAGLHGRKVSWKPVEGPFDFPEGAWRVPPLQFQPEGGIADTTEQTLREDLFKMVKAPREAATLSDTTKDDSIRRRLEWLLRSNGIRVYLVIHLSATTAVQATQKRHLDRIRNRYPVLAVVTIDRELLGADQSLFDEIRPLLMENMS